MDYGLIPTGGQLPPAKVQLLPTPGVANATGGQTSRSGSRKNEVLLGGIQDWGPYEPAIRRQEMAFKHPAPLPTQPIGRNGAQRLSPAFVEWMMGLAPGHVTGLASKCLPHGSLPRPGCPECRKGLSRSAQLKILGNGVVPQQAEAALRMLMERVLGADAEEEAS